MPMQKKSAALLDSMREPLRHAIDEAVRNGVGETWDDIALVLVDLSRPFGHQATEAFGDSARTADDGRTATITMSREQLVAGAPELGLRKRAVDKLRLTSGAPVLCIVGPSDLALAFLRPPKRAREMVEQVWDRLPRIVEDAIRKKVGSKPSEIGVLLTDMTTAYGREFMRAWTKGPRADEPENVAMAVVPRQALVDFVKELPLLDDPFEKLDRMPSAAYVVSVAEGDDLICAAIAPPGAPPTEAELDDAIARALAAGKAASWDDVGLYVVDTRSRDGAEIARTFSPGWKPTDDDPWFMIGTSKRAILELFDKTDQPPRMPGALVVFHPVDNKRVACFRTKPDDA